MGLFDRFARKRGYITRAEVKKRDQYMRRFNSAKQDRLTAGFVSGPVPVDLDLVGSYSVLLGRARDLAKNDDYVRRFLKLVKSNIVGPSGIKLVGQLRTPSGGVDKTGNDAIEAAWKDWGVSPEISGKLSWRGCQNMYAESMARDGEVLILIHPNSKANKYRFSIQFLDPLCLDPKMNEQAKSGNDIVMGVEMDPATRKAVAYWIIVQPTLQPYVDSSLHYVNGKTYRRVPAHLMIHRFNQEYCTQTRGFTPMVSGIARLNMLNGYEEAELVRKRASSALMGFYKETGENEYTGDGDDAAGNLIQEFEPGIMERLPAGVDIEFNNPQPNSTDYAVFLKATLRGISAGLGINYNTIANDLEGVNFSSIRTGVLEDRESWMSVQEDVVDDLVWPVFRAWLKSASLAGSIRVKGQAITPDKAMTRFQQVAWQPRRWSWVDPKKDIDAAVIAINARVRSVSDVIRERGQDPDEVFKEIEQEQAKMTALGIEPIEAVITADNMAGEQEND